MHTHICKDCGRGYKTSQSLASHRYQFHRGDESSPPQQTLDLRIHPVAAQTENEMLDEYLEINKNKYDAKDFTRFKAKIKGKNKARKPYPSSKPDNISQRNSRFKAKNKGKNKARKPYPTSKPDDISQPYSQPGSSSGKIKQVYQCHICKENFNSQEDRGVHVEMIHPLCEKCGKRFIDDDTLEKHVSALHAPKLQCHVCDKTFSRINDLIKHMDVHFQCDECNERFLDSPSLFKHRKQHKRNENYGNRKKAKKSVNDGSLSGNDSGNNNGVSESESVSTIDNDNRLVPYHSDKDDSANDNEDTKDKKLTISDVSEAESEATIDNDNRMLPYHSDKDDYANDIEAPSDDDNNSEEVDSNIEEIDGSEGSIDKENEVESEDDIGEKFFSASDDDDSKTMIDYNSVVDIKSDREEPIVEYDRANPLDSRKSMTHKCKVCFKKFKTKKLLKSHMKRHVDPRQKCTFCDKVIRAHKIDKHVKKEHGFYCRVCKHRFKFQTQLLEHITIEHPTCSI